MDEDKTITIVNKAKSQMTHADYELAKADYERKTALRETGRHQTLQQSSADTPSAVAPEPAEAKPDTAATIRQLHQLLGRADLSPEDRAMLEKRLRWEETSQIAASAPPPE